MFSVESMLAFSPDATPHLYPLPFTYVFTVGAAHAPRVLCSVPSRQLEAMEDFRLNATEEHESQVPTGTTESSPRFQPWVASGKWPEPRRPAGRKKRWGWN